MGETGLVAPRAAVAGVLNGLSLTRIGMHDLVARHVAVSGTVLDLGAGRDPSYRPYLRGTAAEYLRVDGSEASAPDAVVDLERERLPFGDASADVVLAFNLLEHLYNHEHVLNEARRVLRADGILYVWVPFLIGYHPSPEDFFRYSEPALRRKLGEAGYADVDVRSVGGRFTAAANLALPGVPMRGVRAVFAVAAIALDRQYHRGRRLRPDAFPLGYLAAARSPR